MSNLRIFQRETAAAFPLKAAGDIRRCLRLVQPTCGSQAKQLFLSVFMFKSPRYIHAYPGSPPQETSMTDILRKTIHGNLKQLLYLQQFPTCLPSSVQPLSHATGISQVPLGKDLPQKNSLTKTSTIIIYSYQHLPSFLAQAADQPPMLILKIPHRLVFCLD
ncbi:hypothetical protein CRENBAI_000242 [Crenichthys baileyi]|uniref:Uncharacterized protein n=1 Tax=Crenichthys baileyi TaxID=28760 RepID=A0AAV9SFW1_9TELE